jgi:DNA-binding MarR family transcriptional regulator
MAQLEREPEGLLMGELSRRMMVTGGNVTTIVDQLENEQLVQRLPLAGDRRALRVSLTAAGRRAFADMAVEHEQWVVEMFAPLSSTQQLQLHRLLGTLKRGNTPSQQVKP